MSPPRRSGQRTYTLEEKTLLVTEIARRSRAGEGTLRSIAASLGTTDQNYHNWLKAGIRPVLPPPPPSPRTYDPAEREHVVAEVDRLRGESPNLKEACRKVGISDKSYRRWKEDLAPTPAMRPVEVTALVPAPPTAMVIAPPVPAPTPEAPPVTTVTVANATALTLVAPGGYRIEGLAVETAAQLLRALAC